MTLPLIGIVGRKRSGKDTVARHLIAAYGYSRVAFADNVREMALAINPIVGHVVTDSAPRWAVGPVSRLWPSTAVPVRLSEIVETIGWEQAKEIAEVRRLLQTIGTEAVREIIGATTWIDLAMQQADALNALSTPVVITDVRYENEADAIRSRGGMIIKVMRDWTPLPADAHASERLADWYPADYRLLNDRDIAALYEEVDHVMRSSSEQVGHPLISHPLSCPVRVDVERDG